MKEENPFNMGRDPGQMNVLNGEQFFEQQNRQSPVPMREENPFQQPERKRHMGDVLTTTAPNIQKGTPSPHGNRGVCSKCHVLL